MPDFLEKVAREILTHHPDLRNIEIVLPSRRAAVFLKEEFGKLVDRPVWSPRIITSEDFVLESLNMELADQATLIFKLYQSYVKLVPEPRDSFAEFIHWGMMLLADYNELDRYLVDEQQLFDYLSDIERIKRWDLQAGEMSDMLKSYLKMWESLPGIYREFTNQLKRERRVYQGLAYRESVDKLENLLENIIARKSKIYFVGFNALNKAEEQIMLRLYREGLATFYWDVDHYYFSDKNQEAGLFLRKSLLVKALLDKDQFHWITDDLSSGGKKIRIISANGDHEQALVANKIISENSPADQKQIAMVMADERLLPAFLNNLSDHTESLNITMGLPLKESSLAGFFELLLGMFRDQEQSRRVDANGNPAFHHQKWNDLLSHSLSHLWMNQSANLSQLQDTIVQRNYIYLSAEQLEEWYPEMLGQSVLDFFGKVSNSSISQSWCLLAELAEDLFHRADTKLNLPQSLYGFFKVFNRLAELMKEYPFVQDWQTALRFFRDLLAAETVDIMGDPLQGLQVMGMLETRTLDFKKVVISSLNEDVLPKGRSENSLIPFEVRREFGLPTYLDKDAVFAYHFYRLLQRAEDITLIYNNAARGLHTGEPSRFIRQLQFELKERNEKVSISEQSWHSEIKPAESESVTKSASVLRDMKNVAMKGISPSALIDYVNDGTEFYRKRILKLQEAEEVEEVAGYDTQGNVVHKILEDFYRPVLDYRQDKGVLNLDLACYKLKSTELTGLVERQLKEESGLQDLDAGKNLIIKEILTGMIQRFLNKEREELLKLGQQDEVLTLLGLEKNYAASLYLKNGLEVRIHGNIDRVDRMMGSTRIVDYKTGAVDSRNLEIKDWPNLRQPKDGNKSLQLMMYAWLYMKNNPSMATVQAGIISLRDTSKWLIPLKCFGKVEISRDLIQEFEVFLTALLEEIFDPQHPFEKNPVTLQSDD